MNGLVQPQKEVEKCVAERVFSARGRAEFFLYFVCSNLHLSLVGSNTLFVRDFGLDLGH